MIRILIAITALSLSAAVAAPALAETSVVVKLKDKTPAVTFADIATAARAVCRGAGVADPHGIYVDLQCVADTVAATLDKVKSPALDRYARTREARVQLASN